MNPELLEQLRQNLLLQAQQLARWGATERGLAAGVRPHLPQATERDISASIEFLRLKGFLEREESPLSVLGARWKITAAGTACLVENALI
jgi:hypothetical protein